LVTVSTTEAMWKTKLLSWDGNASVTSQEATVFRKWYLCLTNVTTPTIGQAWDRPDFLNLLFVRRVTDPWCPNSNCGAYASSCFSQVMASFNGNVPAYGTVHPAYFAHLGASTGNAWDRSTPVGGDFTTLFDQDADGDSPLVNTGGPAGRLLSDMSSSALNIVVQSGTSGNPTDPHYDDQTTKWAAVDYVQL
jgi:acyl-homoserine lactone acylase PvdQ